MDFAKYFKTNSRVYQKLVVKMRYAEMLAELSTCKRLQIGCVITSVDFYCDYALGYNGPARKEPHDICNTVEGSCGCIHAEANAISKLATERKDLILVETHSSCCHCAGLILNCGRIACVVFNKRYRDYGGTQRIIDGGISIVDFNTL